MAKHSAVSTKSAALNPSASWPVATLDVGRTVSVCLKNEMLLWPDVVWGSRNLAGPGQSTSLRSSVRVLLGDFILHCLAQVPAFRVPPLPAAWPPAPNTGGERVDSFCY